MAIDLAAIQEALRADSLDGWLLYDFNGSNPIARRVVELDGTTKLTTRRWYYMIPAQGEPLALVHTIERDSLGPLPGMQREYAGRQQLADGLKQLVTGCKRIAMEYSPDCAIPYVSRVDAGTVDALRRLKVEVVSSGDLVQRFEAAWNERALVTHREASERLYRIKDRAFALIGEQVRTDAPIHEFEIQQAMTKWFEEEQLVTDCPPVVAAAESTGNPHYLPTATRSRRIHGDEIILLDLWGKLDVRGAVFADITWVGYTGSTVPDEHAAVFAVIRDARDTAISLVENATRDRRDLRGWEVDRAARGVIDQAGFGQYFVHRTGHSLSEAVHGNGVHMDDYETHDERRLLSGTGFTIEPGIYFDRFGVRTEVNMHVGDNEATVTGPAQKAIVTLT